MRDVAVKMQPWSAPQKSQAVFQILLFIMFAVSGSGGFESRTYNRVSALLTIPTNFLLNFASGNVFAVSVNIAMSISVQQSSVTWQNGVRKTKTGTDDDQEATALARPPRGGCARVHDHTCAIRGGECID